MPGFLNALSSYSAPENLTPYAPALPGSDFVPAQTNWSGMGAPMGAGGSNGMFGIQGLGANIGTAQLALGGLQAIGGVWSALQQNKLAKKSFNFQKGILDTNMANQIKAYNQGLDDKLRSRAVVEGANPDQTAANYAKWAATDQRKGY